MRQPTQTQEPLTAKGVLRKEEGHQAFDLHLFEPHPELRPWVEYYWAVEWHLGAHQFVQSVITNPTIDLSFEDDWATNQSNACVVATGVTPRSYQRTLRGHGDVFAVHFHPGMFRSWWGKPVNTLTGNAVRLGTHLRRWETAATALMTTLLTANNQERVRMVDALLLEHLPTRDVVGEDIRDLVHAARHDRTLWDTRIMAQRRKVSARTNQRQFLEYVGVGPKWVAQRYRVQAAIDLLDAERLGSEAPGDLTQLALELGYFDLAHFSREFRAVTGDAPSKYRKVSPGHE